MSIRYEETNRTQRLLILTNIVVSAGPQLRK